MEIPVCYNLCKYVQYQYIYILFFNEVFYLNSYIQYMRRSNTVYNFTYTLNKTLFTKVKIL